jgi:hypothetical protein
MPQVNRRWIVNGREPINPAIVLQTVSEQGWPSEWAGKVNSVHCPRGRFPGEAHFLVTEEHKAAIPTGAAININFEEVTRTGDQWLVSSEETLTGYYLIRTQAATKDKTNPPHWITLADRRWLLERSACNERYNLRNEPGSDGYIDATTNGGTPWTWAEIFADLWALLPGVAGTAPTLPITPGSTPENLIFEGIGTWRAVNQLLCAIGCVVVLDPFEGTFTVEEAKATQSGLATLKSVWSSFLLWQYSPVELPATNYPANAVVTFHGIPGDDTTMDPFRPVPEVEEAAISGGAFGTEYAITDTMFHWDDNSSARAARAAELANALTGLLKPLARPWGAVYSGFAAFPLGSELTDVLWISDGTRGFRTIAKFSTSFIEFPELHVQPSGGGGSGKMLMGKVTDQGTASTGDWIGLTWVDVRVIWGPDTLIATTVRIYDHSGDILDLEDLTDYSVWAAETRAHTLDTSKDCDVLTPLFWAAVNRGCEPGNQIYRTCEGY